MQTLKYIVCSDVLIIKMQRNRQHKNFLKRTCRPTFPPKRLTSVLLLASTPLLSPRAGVSMPAGDAVDAGIKTRQKSTYIDISRAGKDEVWEWIEVASGYLAEQKPPMQILDYHHRPPDCLQIHEPAENDQ